MMNVFGGLGSMFGPQGTSSIKSVIVKELRSKMHTPDICGEWSVSHGEDGKALLQCARCKDRKYCSSDCQMKHWNIYKKLCKPATA